MQRRDFLVLMMSASIVALKASPGRAYKGCSVVSPFPPGSHFNDLAQSLVERAKEADPEAEFELLPAGSLGSYSETLQAVQGGAIDIGIFPTSLLSRRETVYKGLSLPGLFNNVEEARDAISSSAVSEILQSAGERLGIHTLSFGWDLFTLLSVRALRTFSDLNGLKIRVVAPMVAEALALAGAKPISISFAEVYNALAAGVLDAVVSTSDGVRRLLPDANAKGALDPRVPILGLYPVVLAVSLKSWARLSDKERAVLRRAAGVAAQDFLSVSDERRKEMAMRMEEFGLGLLRPESQGVRAWLEKLRGEMHANFSRQSQEHRRLLSALTGRN